MSERISRLTFLLASVSLSLLAAYIFRIFIGLKRSAADLLSRVPAPELVQLDSGIDGLRVYWLILLLALVLALVLVAKPPRVTGIIGLAVVAVTALYASGIG